VRTRRFAVFLLSCGRFFIVTKSTLNPLSRHKLEIVLNLTGSMGAEPGLLTPQVTLMGTALLPTLLQHHQEGKYRIFEAEDPPATLSVCSPSPILLRAGQAQ
jgi:hypothetical protein